MRTSSSSPRSVDLSFDDLGALALDRPESLKSLSYKTSEVWTRGSRAGQEISGNSGANPLWPAGNRVLSTTCSAKKPDRMSCSK